MAVPGVYVCMNGIWGSNGLYLYEWRALLVLDCSDRTDLNLDDLKIDKVKIK